MPSNIGLVLGKSMSTKIFLLLKFKPSLIYSVTPVHVITFLIVVWIHLSLALLFCYKSLLIDVIQ